MVAPTLLEMLCEEFLTVFFGNKNVGAIHESPAVTGGVLCEKIVSVLFGKIAAKRTKNGV